jgi:hypothetical protein
MRCSLHVSNGASISASPETCRHNEEGHSTDAHDWSMSVLPVLTLASCGGVFFVTLRVFSCTRAVLFALGLFFTWTWVRSFKSPAFYCTAKKLRPTWKYRKRFYAHTWVIKLTFSQQHGKFDFEHASRHSRIHACIYVDNLYTQRSFSLYVSCFSICFILSKKTEVASVRARL